MLKQAILYEAELKQRLRETWFVDKYKYYWFDGMHQDVELITSTDHNHQFVSINSRGEVVGYIAYGIDRQSYKVTYIGMINFTDDKMTFGRDLCKAISDIFEKFKFNKLMFSCVVDNPIYNSYEKLALKYGGRLVGIYKEDTFINGETYDVASFEVLRSDYLRNRPRLLHDII